MDLPFVTPSFEKSIYGVMNDMFRDLDNNDQRFLMGQLVKIMNAIAIKFNFDLTDRSKYEKQFLQNNGRDIRGLVLLMLPFIDEGISSMTNIKSLNELYTAKKKDGVQDITKGQPKYIYSNIQFNRCLRKYDDDRSAVVPDKEREFHKDHVIHNTYLILESIDEMANKLYVNWINVRPISNADYMTTSSLYKETEKHTINQSYSYWDPIKDNRDGRDYRGLSVGDVYNTLSKYLYDDIKDIKWLIYDIMIDEYIYPYIVILGSLLDLKLILNGLNWENLTVDEVNDFETKWRQLIQRAKSGQSYEGYTNDVVVIVLKSIVVFFERGYRDLEEAINDGYIRINAKMDEEDEEGEEPEERTIRQATFASLLPSIESIKPNHIYNYLKSTIDRFLHTWYGVRLTDYDKKSRSYSILSLNDIKKREDEFGVGASLKIMYNFSKSFTHQIIDGKFTIMPRLWKSLSTAQKDEIVSRLNTSDPGAQKWFKINRILRNVYNVPEDDISSANAGYFGQIHGHIHKIVFDVLTTNGILSEFVPDASLTDNSQLPDDLNERAKRIGELLNKNIMKDSGGEILDKWKKSYYFLTNTKFDDMNNVIFRKQNKKLEKSYLNQIAEDPDTIGMWNITYAMDWISQIGFFHRYINNRVIYVTGSTGVGKSTQVPKLLLYALKMIDYNPNGKIVCTQPRIPPTTGNAKTISTQMGVPIEKYNDKFKQNLPTDNFYVQYKYKNGQHTNRIAGLTLKIVTDGSLYEELKSNPILKVMDRTTEPPSFRSNNLYDVVIIDEAHEHNSNMDMILTMMKYAVYYNNNIKLIIISATMDQDEPIYRYYYRDVNDNRLSPLSTFVIDNKLDRINVDRRLHISPPGETTRFKITDREVSLPQRKDKVDPADELVIEIMKGTTSGDLLLFKAGVRDIDRSIEYLNQRLPPNVIALPLHGKMPEEKKEFVQAIDKRIYNLTIPRTINFSDNYDESSIEKVKEGTYNRAVIIATNIAEASITVGSLKFVVETGSQKVENYDYRIRDSTLVTTDISESSRLQRRGRVGRVSSGTVYYTYPIKSKEYVKTAYGISVKDISDDIFNLLRNRYDEPPLIPDDLNPNLSSFNADAPNARDDIKKIISRQYYLNGVFQDYQGDLNHYDYQNRQIPSVYYQTGYSYSTLLDRMGKFYIIHPEELKFTRDIIGNIVGISGDLKIDKDGIESPKMDSFFEILKERLMIYTVDDKDINKTEYGVKLSEIKQRLDVEDIRDVIAYLYSRVYEASDLVIASLILKNSLGASIGNLFSQSYNKTTGKLQVDIQAGKDIYGNSFGDSVGLAKIASKIVSYFDNAIYDLRKLFNRKIDARIVGTLSEDLLEKKMDYINNKNTGDFKLISYEVAKKFAELDISGKLLTREELSEVEIKNMITERYLPDTLTAVLEERRPDIDKWAHQNKLSGNTIISFLKSYLTVVNKLYEMENSITDEDEQKLQLEWFDKRLIAVPEYKFIIEHKIIMSFLHGYGFNVAMNVIKTDKFIPISYPDPSNIRGISRKGPFKAPLKETLLNDTSMGEYITFVGYDSAKEKNLFCISRVTSNMIQSAVPFIYSPERYLKVEIPSDLTLLKPPETGFYLETVDKVKLDMINSYTPTVYNNISNIDDNQDYKQFIADKLRKYNRIRLQR
jgi:hypothetical protein